AYQMLLLDDRSVAPPDLAPAAVQVSTASREGSFRGRFFIDLDAPAGLLVGPEVAIFHHGAALEDFLGTLVKRRVLLNAKVVADQVERDIGRMADRRNVAGTVPGRLDAKVLGQDRDLAGRRTSAGLGDMHADVID